VASALEPIGHLRRRAAPGSDPAARRSSPRAFGPASEQPFRRRPSDWLHLIAYSALFVIAALHAAHPFLFERRTADVARSSGVGLATALRITFGAGALWAAGLVGAAAVLARRWRLARAMVCAGLAAWAFGRLATFVVHRQLADPVPLSAVHFPSVRLAVIVAIIGAAAPYLGRPARWIGDVVVAGVAVAAVTRGFATPDDVIGALFLGAGIAAAVHLTLGSPGGRPTARQVEAILDRLGFEAAEVHLAPEQPPGATAFTCHDAVGALRVKVIGRDEVDARLLERIWRFLVFRDPGPALRLTRRRQVEHEAFATMLAQSNGVRVPTVLFAGTTARGAALLLWRPLEGRDLEALRGEVLSDRELEAIWSQVAELHAAGISHGALNAHHIVVDGEDAGLVNFAAASTARHPLQFARDVAEVLATLAAAVGPQRAVDSCAATAGSAALIDALPVLQPGALSRTTRGRLGRSRREIRQQLEALREAAAGRAGTEVPPLQGLYRASRTSVFMVVGGLLAAAVLLDQIGHPGQVWATMQRANWGWLTLALTLSLATNLPFALALMGTVPIQLPLWPTTELQLGMSWTNLVVPLIGGGALQVRFLQCQGVEMASAVAAGGVASTAGTIITQVALFGLALWLSPDAIHLGSVSATVVAGGMLTVIAGLALSAIAVTTVPRIRNAVLAPVRRGLVTIMGTLGSWRRLTLLLGGNVAASVLYGVCLIACLQAFGEGLSIWTVLAIQIGAGTLAALIPAPGGGTAIGTVGVSVALSAYGIPTPVAVSAALMNQLVVNYLPAVPGWFATRRLLRRDYL